MREDLELRDMAKKLGWTESFNVMDRQSGKTGKTGNTVEDCPHLPITFNRPDKVLWRSSGTSWACADLSNTPVNYINHRYYFTLKDALNKEEEKRLTCAE